MKNKIDFCIFLSYNKRKKRSDKVITKAIIVKDDFVVSQEIKHVYRGDITVDCNAIMMAFLASRKSEVNKGILFANGCASLTEASLIISAELVKAVFSKEPETSDEMCAIELLRENNITVVVNPSIILR